MAGDGLENNSSENHTPTVRISQKNKQPLLKAQKRKRDQDEDEDDMEWIPSQQPTGAIKKIWSDKDEITLLEVLKKISDKSNSSSLYEAVKPCLDAEYSRTQVSDKVRRLKKKKFMDDALPASSHDAKINKLCKEIWSETVVVGPHMTQEDFQARYPLVNASIDNLAPYKKMTVAGKDVIRACLLFISPNELDQMEEEWAEYYEEEMVRIAKQMMLSNKEAKLLQKGRMAYNLAH